jgi:hypothetical protein
MSLTGCSITSDVAARRHHTDGGGDAEHGDTDNDPSLSSAVQDARS